MEGVLVKVSSLAVGVGVEEIIVYKGVNISDIGFVTETIHVGVNYLERIINIL